MKSSTETLETLSIEQRLIQRDGNDDKSGASGDAQPTTSAQPISANSAPNGACVPNTFCLYGKVQDGNMIFTIHSASKG